MLKVDKLEEYLQPNVEIVEVNIGFDCESNIVLENVINLNKTCNHDTEIAREETGFHYE